MSGYRMKLTTAPLPGFDKRHNHRIISLCLPVAFFLIGFYYFNLRIAGTRFEYMPGDWGDSRFINYLLEHGYQFICGHLHSFWDAGVMYPYKPAIALSDNMLGTMPIYSLFRILGCSRETAYQCWWMTISALNYWCCYLVLRKWTGQNLLSVCGAYIFAFGLFNLSQLNFMQMNCRFMVPPVLFAAYKLATEPRLNYFALWCLGVLFQLYCVMYTGFILLYFSLLFILLLLVFNRSFSVFKFYLNRKRILLTLGICLISASLMFLLIRPYLITSKDTGFRLYREVVPNLPTLQSYFFAHPASITWHFLSEHSKTVFPEWWLQDIFPGGILLLAFAGSMVWFLSALIHKRKKDPLFLALAATSLLIFLVFTRTPGNHTLYGLIIKLPGMNSLRVLTRFMHVQLFFLILLPILAFQHFLSQSRFRTAFLILLPLLILADNQFTPDALTRTMKSEQQTRIEKLSARIRSQDYRHYKALAYLPGGNEPVFKTQLDMMIVAQDLGVNCVNGYSSSCPPAFGLFFLKEHEEGLNKWLEETKTDSKDILIMR